jgi:hypothetical protein
MKLTDLSFYVGYFGSFRINRKSGFNQCFGSGILGLIPIRIRIQSIDDQKFKKFTAETFFIYIFLIKNCNLIVPRPP